MLANIKWILTDIEGTTTDVAFVYDVLFPYFRTHLGAWKNVDSMEMNEVLSETQRLVSEEIGATGLSREMLFNQLLAWSLEDRKVTPLKQLQGMVWKTGFESGALKGHVYPDVLPSLQRWKSLGINVAIFSSGSIAAQKQLFGYSVDGDLTSFFSDYFDTTTGMKREVETYLKIAGKLNCPAAQILFLSDIPQELEAAKAAGMDTLQLLRPGIMQSWPTCVSNFNEIK